MKQLIILTFTSLISFTSLANIEILNKEIELSLTVTSTFNCDKQCRKARRKQRRWNRKFNVPKNNCNKTKKIKIK